MTTSFIGKLESYIQRVDFDVDLEQNQWATPYANQGILSTSYLKTEIIGVTGDPQAPFSYIIRDNKIIFFCNAKHLSGQYFVLC
nr:MAG TPA: hypothetical protein [Caudoviricetes sp.]